MDQQRHVVVRFVRHASGSQVSLPLASGEQLADTLDEIQLCQEQAISNCNSALQRLNTLISWSPNNEYLAITLGHTEGIRIIPSSALLVGEVAPSQCCTLTLTLHQESKEWGDTDISLFHFPIGWKGDSFFYFSAGLSGIRNLYRYDPVKQELRGQKYNLNAQDPPVTFIDVKVETFTSPTGYAEFSQLSEQVRVLDQSPASL